MDQDTDLLQDLTLDDSLAADNLSIEVILDEDTSGAQKYISHTEQIPYKTFLVRRSRDISSLHFHTIIYNVSVASSTPDLCEHTPED